MTETSRSEISRTVTVTGSGSAEAVPDLLTLSIGVECRRDTVGTAYSEAGKVSAAVAAALRRFGVGDPDINTTGLNVRADLVWHEGEGQKVTGYVASSVLSVRVRNVARSSETLAAAVDAGGNDVRLNGLELGFSDPAAVLAVAREAAWQDALASARQFAGLAAAELGGVVSVTQVSAASAPVPLAKIQRAMAAEAINVEAGESSVSSAVTVVWELRG
ncbi:SIMPL domain-containing protein [Pseudarthrobacter sp. N5]|uniref:SIMPL domain-containing protein n=1 Tax=Pseudarthrobacter sp. N5 TaxID=3418416 RepID=UPI003CF76A08